MTFEDFLVFCLKNVRQAYAHRLTKKANYYRGAAHAIEDDASAVDELLVRVLLLIRPSLSDAEVTPTHPSPAGIPVGPVGYRVNGDCGLIHATAEDAVLCAKKCEDQREVKRRSDASSVASPRPPAKVRPLRAVEPGPFKETSEGSTEPTREASSRDEAKSPDGPETPGPAGA